MPRMVVKVDRRGVLKAALNVDHNDNESDDEAKEDKSRPSRSVSPINDEENRFGFIWFYLHLL